MRPNTIKIGLSASFTIDQKCSVLDFYSRYLLLLDFTGHIIFNKISSVLVKKNLLNFIHPFILTINIPERVCTALDNLRTPVNQQCIFLGVEG